MIRASSGSPSSALTRLHGLSLQAERPGIEPVVNRANPIAIHVELRDQSLTHEIGRHDDPSRTGIDPFDRGFSSVELDGSRQLMDPG